MPVNIIDTLKPKNGLNFPIVEAIDVFVENYGNLADAISHFATDAMIAAINAVLSGKANTADVNTSVANLQAQINQLITPVTQDAEVQNARVDSDGISYTTLKERLDAEQEASSNAIDKINTLVGIIKNTTSNSGYYISSSGNKSASTNGRMSDVISLNAGDIISVVYTSGTSTSISVISEYDADHDSYTTLVTNGGSSSNLNFSYTASKSIDIVVSWLATTGADITINTVSGIKTMADNVYGLSNAIQSSLAVSLIDLSLTLIQGYYTTDGTISPTGKTSYNHSLISVTAGEKYIITYKDCPTAVVVVGFFDENDVFTSKKRGAGEGASVIKKYTFTATSNGTLAISGRSSENGYTCEKITTNPDAVDANIDVFYPAFKEKAINDVPWRYALDTILCIGDSLTAGVPPVTETMPNPMKQNYPFYLSRMINTDCTNAGVGGINTTEWYTEEYSKYDMTEYNAMIIFLGTNGGLTDTLDTDVEPYEDYNDYAETHTGYYCRLIERLQNDNPNSIIIMVNVWRTTSVGDETRTTLDKIANRYELPIVETQDLVYDSNPDYHGNHNNVHMTKTGYLALADRICKTIDNYFASHIAEANKGMTRR